MRADGRVIGGGSTVALVPIGGRIPDIPGSHAILKNQPVGCAAAERHAQGIERLLEDIVTKRVGFDERGSELAVPDASTVPFNGVGLPSLATTDQSTCDNVLPAVSQIQKLTL